MVEKIYLMMYRNISLLKKSVSKFDLKLSGHTVFTEAATGNFVCTPILAALAGAFVFALAKDSKYGTKNEIESAIVSIARDLQVEDRIRIVENIQEIPLNEVDILTNTGFVRPINRILIDSLKSDCVIPLMWEPWEFREKDLDLDYANKKGIKVYGTNENDPRLNTLKYIGLVALHFLLLDRKSPFSAKVLIIGCEKFNYVIDKLLSMNGYDTTSVRTGDFNLTSISDFNFIIVADNISDKEIIGHSNDSLISTSNLDSSVAVLHIAGNVDFVDAQFKHYPKKPAPAMHMSFTTDFIDPIAVFDLHAAGLKVAEGMIFANSLGLVPKEYRSFMESNYPALGFDEERYW